MTKINSKSSLAIVLSKLKVFENPKVSAEQYPTDSEVAASVLWDAFMCKDLKSESIIADFGAGTGILGIGCLILGVKRVYFIDSDKDALKIAQNNYEILKSERIFEGEGVFVNSGVEEFNEKVDLVVQNPPFGVKVRHADKKFLEKAFNCAPVVWSIHMGESIEFLKRFSDEKGFEVSRELCFELPLKSTMKFHKKRIHRIKVCVVRFYRREN